MLSPRYSNRRCGSSMWKDALEAHLTQDEFRVIRVSTEIFKTMQSLPSDDASACVIWEFVRQRIAPKASQCFA